MVRGSLVALCVAAIALTAGGCTSGPPVEPVAKVRGKVTLDGKPMPDGMIYFALPGSVPDQLPIRDGTFEGQAKVGKPRVEIRAFKAGQAPAMYGKSGGDAGKGIDAPRVNYIPDRYNTTSVWTAEVTPNGPNEFTYDVKSR